MNTTIVPEVVVSAIPAKQLYWQGYDMFVEAYFANDPLTADELAAMSPQEKRGYEFAARCQVETEADDYMTRLNVNAYGDRTEW